MFCGSATCRRWKSAPAGNSSVSVSSASPVGVASVRRLAIGIERSRTASRMLRSHASRDLLELDGWSRRSVRRRRLVATWLDEHCLRRTGRGGLRGARLRCDIRRAGLEELDAVHERLAREIRRRAGHLHERELEREPRVGALADVVHRDCEEVDEPEHRRLGQLVRLLAQALLHLLGDRQRLGDVAHVLDEEQVPQVLEEVGDDAPEILALLCKLLEEEERAGRVVVDDRVAEPQERLLVDCADELEHRLRVDRVVRRSVRAGRASRRRRGRSRAPSAR